MRILFGWMGWKPRYERSNVILAAFYNKRLYLWFVSVQWDYNNAEPISLDELFAAYSEELRQNRQ